MTPFNNELQVGQPAMVIGCHNPANSSVIGKVVVVERLPNIGDNLVDFYEGPHHVVNETHEGMSFCSGVEAKIRSMTKDGRSVIIPNHIRLDRKYLMPLPPLGDVYDQEKKDELENLRIYS